MDLIAGDGARSMRDSGLTQVEAASALAKYGPNALPERPPPGILLVFAQQFLSPFIYILVVAAAVSLLLGQVPNAVFIVIVLLINASIGTAQEYSAEKAAAALKNMVKGQARVVRDGLPMTVEIENVVPGDLVLLSSGDKVPADIELTLTKDLAVDESLLTGESLAVTKNARANVVTDAPLSARFNACFAATVVTHGRGQGLVTATGTRTELGKIAHEVTDTESSEPPLVLRIKRFTLQLASAIGIAILLLLMMMLVRGGYTVEVMITMAIGLAVSTIPEGLPAALSVALAIGMQRMARLGVIIRKLVAVEALGSCTFICSDKTGTLTVNELTVRKIALPDGREFDVSGAGVAPGGSVDVSDGAVLDHLKSLCKTGLLANESHLDYAGGEWASDGDIVDVAFLVLAKKLGLSLSQVRANQRQLDLIPYESERAFSGSLNLEGETPVIHVKGSPERLLQMCAHARIGGNDVPLDRDRLQQHCNDLAGRGYRIIALARRESDGHHTFDEHGDDIEGLTLLGMVAMIDPVRPEAKDAVARCREGGIEVAMVTGDHPATAKAIALELGLCDRDATVMTGEMLRDLSQSPTPALDSAISNTRVFARIEPTQKSLIVASLMRQGHFVAVTGDGVNDAPAMRQAHVGVAMGKRGTDVAKESADLIITDDNFASIVHGVEQGRIVYNNIQKVIALLVATGFSAIVLFFLCVGAGLPVPLTAIQLLWLNLVANGVQDVALAFEPGESGELKQPPRDPAEPVFSRRVIEHVLVAGSVMGVFAFGTFAWLINSGAHIDTARNLTLMLMVIFGNLHAWSSRSETRSLFQMSMLSNPFLVAAVPLAQFVHITSAYVPGLNNVLAVQPISLAAWLGLFGVALSLVVVEEVHKAHLRNAGSKPGR